MKKKNNCLRCGGALRKDSISLGYHKNCFKLKDKKINPVSSYLKYRKVEIPKELSTIGNTRKQTRTGLFISDVKSSFKSRFFKHKSKNLQEHLKDFIKQNLGYD